MFRFRRAGFFPAQPPLSLLTHIHPLSSFPSATAAHTVVALSRPSCLASHACPPTPRHARTDNRPLSPPRAALRPQGTPPLSTPGDRHQQPGNTGRQSIMHMHTVGGRSLLVRNITQTCCVPRFIGNGSRRRSRAAEIAPNSGYPVARDLSRAFVFYDSCRETHPLQAKTGIQYRRFYSKPPQQMGRVVGGALNS